MKGHTRVHAGGCLCGSVRYQALGDPEWVAHCHCGSCRRNTGAVLATFAGFTTSSFRYVTGTPARYHSSPGVTRIFCPGCGTPLTYETERSPDEVHINLGSLDDPQSFVPTLHVHAAEQLAWLRVDDDLPRYARTPRDSKPIPRDRLGRGE